MSASDLVLRPATAQDVSALTEDGAIKSTGRYWSIYWNGMLSAVAGYSVSKDGIIVAYNMISGIDPPKMTIWRAAKLVMKKIEEQIGSDLYAAPRDNAEGPKRFLSRLGFSPAGVSLEGHDIYRKELKWQARD